ncbi:MAG: mercuric reductase [Polyangiaceae bacterium]|nr:mercuric reductase [Polyangiaceae bacterium]
MASSFPSDETLDRLVRPSDWTNPTPLGRYNLVVIGGGPAGLVAAAGAAGLGAKVALIEKHRLGGDCLNTGCVPSKALLRAASAAYHASHGSEFGIIGAAPKVDFHTAMNRVHELRAQIAENDAATRFAELGVHVFFGEGKFIGSDRIAVDEDVLRFRRAVIATGARPKTPPIPGLADVPFRTHEDIFDLTELPAHLVVIGAGPIGCELAQAFRRLGSEVTVLDAAPRLLFRGDADASAVLAEQFADEGIRTHLGVEILEAESDRSGLKLRYRGGSESSVSGSCLLVAAGRAPNVESLGLADGGVITDKRGVQINDQLRTSNRRIYAAGDVCSSHPFTHSADAQARIVIQNALFFGRKKSSALTVPAATYTQPEIASVGISSEEASSRDDVLTLTVPMAEMDRGMLDSHTRGFGRLHVAKGNGKILGATLVSSHAGESISEVTLAMTHGLGAGALAATLHPYPTEAEIWKRLGDAWNKTRFTPTVANLFARFLGWFSED